MILQALKNMYPKASEKVLRAVMKDLEKCRDTIEEALRINTKDDSKPSQVGDESSFAITEGSDEGNN